MGYSLEKITWWPAADNCSQRCLDATNLVAVPRRRDRLLALEKKSAEKSLENTKATKLQKKHLFFQAKKSVCTKWCDLWKLFSSYATYKYSYNFPNFTYN